MGFLKYMGPGVIVPPAPPFGGLDPKTSDIGSPKFFILQGSLSDGNFQFIPLPEGSLDNVEKTLDRFQTTKFVSQMQFISS